MVKKLAAAGKSIIYVSHRLDEIFKITDRITVLRDGESQSPRRAEELNVNSLVELMLGRKLENMFPERSPATSANACSRSATCGPTACWSRSASTSTAARSSASPGNSAAAPAKSSRRSPASHKTRSGIGRFRRRDLSRAKSPPPRSAARSATAPTTANMTACSSAGRSARTSTSPALRDACRASAGISAAKEQKVAHDLAEKFTVDVARLNAEAGVLSGGNQQKVALGKWLAITPEVILVNEPTRGVDVGAKAEIYAKLRDLADGGAAIVFASTDMQEITYLPDRVITFYRGMQIGGFHGAEHHHARDSEGDHRSLQRDRSLSHADARRIRSHPRPAAARRLGAETGVADRSDAGHDLRGRLPLRGADHPQLPNVVQRQDHHSRRGAGRHHGDRPHLRDALRQFLPPVDEGDGGALHHRLRHGDGGRLRLCPLAAHDAGGRRRLRRDAGRC